MAGLVCVATGMGIDQFGLPGGILDISGTHFCCAEGITAVRGDGSISAASSASASVAGVTESVPSPARKKTTAAIGPRSGFCRKRKTIAR